MPIDHDELALSLAEHLRAQERMVWCDMQLGSSGSPRPDVYAIFKSYVRPQPMAFEVKYSVSDFRSDVTSGKWQTYLKYACGVVFACEGTLIKPDDLPGQCGLIAYNAELKTWRMKKKPVLSVPEIPRETYLKLLIDGVNREGPHRTRDPFYSREQKAVRKKFGDTVADIIRDTTQAAYNIEMAEKTAKRIVDNANIQAQRIRDEDTIKMAPIRKQMCEALGLPETADTWKIVQAAKAISNSAEMHPALRELKNLTTTINRAISIHGYKEPEKCGDESA